MWGIIATWTMAYDGVEIAQKLLARGEFSGDAIVSAVKNVEDFPFYKSVGYGGLPNEEMEVELDAAYMNGTNFDFGAVCAIKDFENPILIAKKLSEYKANNILVSEGAEKFAHKNGFVRKNMLTDRAKIHYKNRLKQIELDKAKEIQLSAYNGHDTVGMIALDNDLNMVAATSTSGLFMKRKGRVGDSPIIGSGLYVDSEIGGASATGMGEDIMKGIASYEVVRCMKEGMNVQRACEKVCFELERDLIRRRGSCSDISLVAMDKNGKWGCASNIVDFSFVVATSEQPATVYVTNRDKDCMKHKVASKKWVDDYMTKRMMKLEEL